MSFIGKPFSITRPTGGLCFWKGQQHRASRPCVYSSYCYVLTSSPSRAAVPGGALNQALSTPKCCAPPVVPPMKLSLVYTIPFKPPQTYTPVTHPRQSHPNEGQQIPERVNAQGNRQPPCQALTNAQHSHRNSPIWAKQKDKTMQTKQTSTQHRPQNWEKKYRRYYIDIYKYINKHGGQYPPPPICMITND